MERRFVGYAVSVAVAAAALLAVSCEGLSFGTGLSGTWTTGRVVDHEDANVAGLTARRIENAKDALIVAYWHTSHGSQLVTGVDGMDEFYGGNGWYTLNGESGLPLSEPGADVGGFGGDVPASVDLFEAAVRAYLAAYPSTNVVAASWCGQVSGASSSDIQHYLSRMSALEADYPAVTFVYMTGHADGGGLDGNLHERNQQIREFCEAGGKWFYDFYDIECYDPDGEYFGDRLVTDSCNYDYDGDGTAEGGESGPSGGDRNWAIDWQTNHAGQWWDCESQHSQPLNANLKAMAAWQLWCAIAEGR